MVFRYISLKSLIIQIKERSMNIDHGKSNVCPIVINFPFNFISKKNKDLKICHLDQKYPSVYVRPSLKPI